MAQQLINIFLCPPGLLCLDDVYGSEREFVYGSEREFVYGSERWQIPEEVLAEEAVYRQSLLDQNITCMDVVNDTVPFGLLVNGTGCPADSPLMMYALYLAIVTLVLSLAAYARRGTSGVASRSLLPAGADSAKMPTTARPPAGYLKAQKAKAAAANLV